MQLLGVSGFLGNMSYQRKIKFSWWQQAAIKE